MKKAVQDTIQTLHIPSPEEMQSYWNNPDLTYSEEVAPQGENIIAYLIRNFFEWLEDLIGKAQVDTAWQYIKVFLVLFVIYFVLTKIFKVGIFSIFSKKNKAAANKVVLNDWQEDIHTINFDEKINRAVQQGNFREAVRLRFLKILKLLTDNNHIRWSIEKTNRDYLNELTNNKLHAEFKNTALIFDYIWYGEYSIKNNEEYKKFEQQFISTEHTINNREPN